MFGYFAPLAGVCYIYLGCKYLMAPTSTTESTRDRIARWLQGIALLAIGCGYLVSYTSH